MLLIQFVMLFTGAFMAAAPGACTRRQSRGDKDAEARTRTMGIWLALAAAIWMITARLF